MTIDYSGVPFIETTITLKADREKVNGNVINVAKQLVPQWSDIDEGLVKVSELSGGITNQLLKLEATGALPLGAPRCATCRIFGDATELVIDRAQEFKVIKYLSDHKQFGSSLYGAFTNGRLESYIDAWTLEPKDMARPEMVTKIARLLHEFHKLDIPGPRTSALWPLLFKWADLAATLSFDDPKKQATFEAAGVAELKGQIEELKRVCDELDSPVVFSHNDLLSGNFMCDNKTGELILIDFEYGMYNNRGFDLGNHFNEYAGFDCDYSLYPDRDAQYLFFRHYIAPEDPASVPESELANFYVEANCFALASHLYWGVWALVQAKHSPIDFDYLGYNKLRLKEYHRRKESVFALARERVGQTVSATC
ncbi:Ethanolamine kinase [Klebsormidium nitens]|uniref:ethanolamine kinase n=1 Tax=Klebsormidium nitens TaxID=105231 RepID=A0A1Y1IHT8_KLENI|nr:Ethanolamine kinase [Klebsormidium nitens]|eukprot:GAQ88641.1 Ethanolamine kinase [Klebsormidium nitens]